MIQDGRTPDRFYDPGRGVHFRTVVRCDQASVRDGKLFVSAPREALIVVANCTSYNGFDKDPVKEGREYRQASLNHAENALRKGWKALKAAKILVQQYMVRIESSATP